MLSKVTRPTYLFVFEDQAKAHSFLEFANAQNSTTIVQHPLSGKGHGGDRDLNRVLITGSGSLLFDANLREELTRKAQELGGDLLPKN